MLLLLLRLLLLCFPSSVMLKAAMPLKGAGERAQLKWATRSLGAHWGLGIRGDKCLGLCVHVCVSVCVCVCICLCVCVCDQDNLGQTGGWESGGTNTCTCVCICVCVCVCVCTRSEKMGRTQESESRRGEIHACARVYVCTCVCICT